MHSLMLHHQQAIAAMAGSSNSSLRQVRVKPPIASRSFPVARLFAFRNVSLLHFETVVTAVLPLLGAVEGASAYAALLT